LFAYATTHFQQTKTQKANSFAFFSLQKGFFKLIKTKQKHINFKQYTSKPNQKALALNTV